MKRILHPTDFSECAQKALEEATALIRACGGELILLHVSVEAPLYNEAIFGLAKPQAVYEAQRKWAEAELAERAAKLTASGVATRSLVRSGVPFEEIVEVAQKEACELIVIGTHGFGGLNRWLLGSVADRVVRLASCPVMTVRMPAA